MSRESDWHVFDKAVELTASAVRGTAGGDVTPSFVAELFREVHEALTKAVERMPHREAKTGF
ncbi:MAG: hypothetical protein KatS3mg013_1363 [Actinomycetota bacterium]|jgi:hypothetical protein|nr:MAG: hypothetical protein KatS3mg013_1363 [Actinomycetota bacterium]